MSDVVCADNDAGLLTCSGGQGGYGEIRIAAAGHTGTEELGWGQEHLSGVQNESALGRDLTRRYSWSSAFGV